MASRAKAGSLSYHVFTRYVKLTFVNGASLCPVPPGSGKDPDARWIDIYEGRTQRGAVDDMDPSGGLPARLAWVLTNREI